MKKSLLVTALCLSPMAFAAPSIGLAPVKHLYVPQGFDSNDAVEVVVTGHFPNPCFSRNTVMVDVVEDRIKVEVTALLSADKKSCPDMAVPFKEVVSIGNLQGGDYQISVNDVLEDKISIGEADSNAVDDHLYAAIDNLDSLGGGNYMLQGWRYSPCIELDKIQVISNGKDTLSILPIMKQVSNFCPMKMTPVSYPVKLDVSGLKSKEPLIYVRTMDGKSFNSILNFGSVK